MYTCILLTHIRLSNLPSQNAKFHMDSSVNLELMKTRMNKFSFHTLGKKFYSYTKTKMKK